MKRSGSYIDSPEWLKIKKATINPQNNDDNCFQYALTVALNHQNIANNLQRIPKIKPFIDQYNWKEIDFHHIQKTGKSSNKTIKQLLLISFLHHTILNNFNCENKVILLMISDGTKWHYLAVKSLSALLEAVTSNYNGDFYCLNCFHSYSTKEKLKNMKKYVMIMIIVM